MNRYFKTIVDHIANGECVLMLGPDAAVEAGKPAGDAQRLSQLLPQYFKGNDALRFDDEGLIHFREASDRLMHCSDLKEFYQTHAPDAVHLSLARIPFHLIVSTAPHHLLRMAFDEQGIPYRFAYFSKKGATDGIDTPASERSPVLYNLFGSIADNDSLILTNDDLFDFLFAILGKNQVVPKEVMRSIQQAKVFIFLGFNFEQWFLKLLFRFFRLHEAPLPLVSEESFASTGSKVKSFYVENFKLKMLEESPADFVAQLAQAFQEGVKNAEGKPVQLREVKAAQEHPLAAHVRKLLTDGKPEEAVEALKDAERQVEAYDEELLTSIDMQASRLNRLNKKVAEGTLSEADASLEMNKIVQALLGVATALKAMPV